jgi:hypothetical protein
MDATRGPALTPSQRHTFEELLAIGRERPSMPVGLVERLSEQLTAGTAEAVGLWTEPRLFLTKSMLASVMNCEGLALANRAGAPSTGLFPAVAVGTVAHQAIQMAHTHPGEPVERYITWSIEAQRQDDARFEELWSGANPARQSDMQAQMVSRVTAFLDTFPPLHQTWTPRFEDPCQAKVGKLTLSARPDLVLGRPRPDAKQSMMIIDFKTGALHEGHAEEAAFYALVATLRHGVAPFRSCVVSLASGEWTEPDVDEAVLSAAAERVVTGVRKLVEVLTDRREPQLTAGAWCRFCPLADSCGTYAAERAA